MPNLRERFAKQRYFYHYLFWAIVVLSYFVDAAELRHFDVQLFFRTLVLKNGLLIAIVYFHLRVLIPAFLNPKHYPAYALSLMLTIAVGAFLINRIENFSWRKFYQAVHSTQEEGREQQGHPEAILEVEEEIVVGPLPGDRRWIDALTVCRYLIISLLLKFMDDFFRQRDQLQQALHEKTMAELDALKAQINPHFLFNTLNNLYGLVLERSDHAAETVLKLADIMKYTLADGNAASVPLKKDLENLRHYFDLERLRLPDEAAVKMNVEGAVENQRIAPLLLLPLVENAFKYGVHRCRERHFLEIGIQVSGENLRLTTRNRKPDQTPESVSFGNGLQNLRKRLELIYPEKYWLDTLEDEQFFHVELKLLLA